MYLLRLIVASIITTCYGSAALLTAIAGREKAISLVLTMYRLILKIFRVELEVVFDDPVAKNAEGIIYISLNQTSLLDSLVCPVAAVRPIRSITNIEYCLVPFVGWTATLFSFVIVRQWHSQSLKTLNRVGDYLRKGGNLGISIEGKRSKDGTISQYKKGPAVIAINHQVDVLPVMIYGSRNCMPYRSWKIKPGKIIVRVLPRISTQGLKYEDRNALIEKLYTIACEEIQNEKVYLNKQRLAYAI